VLIKHILSIYLKEKVERMKKFILIALIMTLGIVAIASAGVGSIKISPAWPNMQASPATFETWVQGGSGSAYDPNVLLVMTESCWSNLVGEVHVHVQGVATFVTLVKNDFDPVIDNSEKVPSSSTNGYTVASLKEHLSYGLSVPLSSTDTIYYCLAALPIDELTGTHETLTVEVTSSDTRVLVYVMGSSVDDSGDLDMRVPPTPAGFVVPEPATIAAIGTSLGALGLYAYRRKRKT
jgi:hypothetical protein